MSYIVTTLMDMSPVEVLSVVFRVCFLVGCGIRLAFGVVRPGRASGVGVCAGERGFRAGPQASCAWVGFCGCGCKKEPPGAWCSTGGPCDGECGGVLLSHILSGAVPSPCQALASGFGMGSGRLTWAMAAANLQFFFPPSRGRGMVPGGGPGTGGWTRCFVVPCLVTVLPVVRGSGRRGRRAVDCPSSVSTGQLHPSRGFHVRPINHVFCMGTAAPEGAWNPYLGAGFPLRCFQRLSLPNVANQPRHWRDDWHTRGSSTQVLSYYGQASSRFRRAQRIETKLSHDVLNPARVPL